MSLRTEGGRRYHPKSYARLFMVESILLVTEKQKRAFFNDKCIRDSTLAQIR